MDLNYIDFQKICRICISTENILQIQNAKLEEQGDVLNILCEFICLEDLLDARLPQNICNNCLIFLNSYQHFKSKCKQSEILLKTCLNNASQCYIKCNEEQNENLVLNDNITDSITYDSDSNFNNDNNEENEDYDDLPLLSRYKRNHSKKKQNKTEVFHKKDKKHSCKFCNKLFTFKYKLLMHIRVHTKEKPFKCDVCNLTFSLNSNLRRHKMIHTGEKPHVCDTCGKGFIQATSLHIHQKTHIKQDSQHNYKCNVCSRVFVRFIPFSLHCKKLHPNENQQKTENSDKTIEENNETKTSYECDICHNKFSSMTFLKRHKSRHGEKKFLCNDCGKSFVRKSDLKSHFKIHTGEKPHICPICNKAFAHSGTLGTHTIMHSGYKPYNCSICFKSFTQLSHLKVHEKTHSGERPYSCQFCEKTFALKQNLTVHVRTHTGETPYMCNICKKGFYDSSSMKKHKQNHLNANENVKKETSTNS